MDRFPFVVVEYLHKSHLNTSIFHKFPINSNRPVRLVPARVGLSTSKLRVLLPLNTVKANHLNRRELIIIKGLNLESGTSASECFSFIWISNVS